MVQDALELLAAANRRLLVLAGLAITSAVAPGACAQSAADHAALAHGKPIVNGHPVQPTPGVVDERLRHHEEMLQAERNVSVRPVIANAPALRAMGPDAHGGSVKP